MAHAPARPSAREMAGHSLKGEDQATVEHGPCRKRDQREKKDGPAMAGP